MAPASAPAQVQNIPVRDISPNPHNPRRLFDEEPMRILKESIDKLGILVPVTVYQPSESRAAETEKFVLLDGERRWRCAGELGLESIPAIIVEEPSAGAEHPDDVPHPQCPRGLAVNANSTKAANPHEDTQDHQ